MDGPSTISLSPLATSYTKTEGDTLRDITCSTVCHPECAYTWSKVGTTGTIRNNALLNLGQLSRQEAGSYICIATNPRSSVTQNGPTVDVKVIFGPNTALINPSNMNYTINENQPIITIVCSATCYPTCTFSWKETTPTLSSASDNHNLALSEVTREEAGTYQYGPDTAALSVISKYTVTEGDTLLNVTCSSHCWPGCSYTWRNVTNNAIMSRNRSLMFGPIDRYMTDTYRCDVANIYTPYTKTARSEFQLLAQYAPDVSIVQSTLTLTEGSTLILTCSANGYPSQYTITGFKQTVGTITIPNDNTEAAGVRDNISVRIPYNILQDTGLYTCMVHNNVKDIDGNLLQTDSTQIDVKVKPRIFLAEDRFAGPTGGQVSISIPIYSNPVFTNYGVQRYDGFNLIEDSKYKFTENDASIQTQFYGRYVTLNGRVLQMTIQNLTEVDFGEYTFWISNEIGSTSASVTLSARSIPSLPTQLNVAVLEKVPVFVWNEGFNGGYVQTFLLQTSSTSHEHLWTNRTSILETDNVYISSTGFYRVNITGLEVGHFVARLIAYNELGNADPVSFQPFEIIKISAKENINPNHVPVIGGVVGGSLGVVVVVVVIVLVFILRRKYTLNCSFNMSLSKKEDVDSNQLRNNADNAGYNAAETYEVVSTMKETPNYDVLNVGNERPDNTHLYTPLDESNSKSHIYYENVKKEDPMYTNTVLKNPVQTVF
ncbi:hemicentin-2-like [Mya arenaria]|uniref:hemicentin-2-like n=1 Tax=Mya arenaria TaxID=6604 RepID=UPI0022E7AD5A|nr:hemicentin-2-like [Mya arenaria]